MSARTWFWVAAAAFAVVVAWSATALPEQVPVHFGIGGDADRFTSRTQAVFESSLVGAGIALTFSLIDLLVRRGPIELVNVPDKRHWIAPEHAPTLRRMMAHDMWVIGTMTMALLVGLEISILAVADQPDPSLGPWTWLMVAGYVVAVFGYGVHMQLHRYRVRER